jgi:hypothetical protein
MRPPVEIENIEELRRLAGIDDAELHQEIRTLRPGDQVRLTFLVDGKAPASATVVVRVVSIRGGIFHGKLETRPTVVGSVGLNVNSSVTFNKDQIHSIVRRKAAQKLEEG